MKLKTLQSSQSQSESMGLLSAFKITTAFEMSGLDSCVSDKMKTQQDLATNLLWPVDWPVNTMLTANKKYREEYHVPSHLFHLETPSSYHNVGV